MILQEAILHIPLSQYAFANSEMNLTIRIRVAKDNLTDCVLCTETAYNPVILLCLRQCT